MEKKGFTLVELLAVIVILAIISLIAVPIVINIINDSKTSSDEQSVELYLDAVEKTITKKQLSDPNFNPDKCKIMSNGNLECYKDNNKIETLQIEVKGTTPEKGIIEIQNNKFIYKNIWFNDKKYYAISNLLDDIDNNNEISRGDKYLYKVNDTDAFNFYVLSVNLDNTVNLIMDRNICEDGKPSTSNNSCFYSWSDPAKFCNNSCGPNMALLKLYNATKKWNNVLDMVIDYKDEHNDENATSGYISVVVDSIAKKMILTGRNGNSTLEIGIEKEPLKARLPYYSEIKCSTAFVASCRYWLVDNLKESSQASRDIANYNKGTRIDNIEGYWLMSSSYRYGGAESDIVNYNGYIYVGQSNSYYNNIGIRPVITVPIDDLN